MKKILSILMLLVLVFSVSAVEAFDMHIEPQSRTVTAGTVFPVKLFITPTKDDELPIYDIVRLGVIVDTEIGMRTVSDIGAFQTFVRFKPAEHISMLSIPDFHNYYSNYVNLKLKYTGNPIITKSPMEIGTLYVKANKVDSFKLYIRKVRTRIKRSVESHSEVYMLGNNDVNSRKSIFLVELLSKQINANTNTSSSLSGLGGSRVITVNNRGLVSANTNSTSSSGKNPTTASDNSNQSRIDEINRHGLGRGSNTATPNTTLGDATRIENGDSEVNNAQNVPSDNGSSNADNQVGSDRGDEVDDAQPDSNGDSLNSDVSDSGNGGNTKNDINENKITRENESNIGDSSVDSENNSQANNNIQSNSNNDNQNIQTKNEGKKVNELTQKIDQKVSSEKNDLDINKILSIAIILIFLTILGVVLMKNKKKNSEEGEDDNNEEDSEKEKK